MPPRSRANDDSRARCRPVARCESTSSGVNPRYCSVSVLGLKRVRTVELMAYQYVALMPQSPVKFFVYRNCYERFWNHWNCWLKV